MEAADKALKTARTKGFVVRADFFFVDENPQHVAFLKDLLLKRGYRSRLEHDIFIRCALFEEACPDILAHIQKKGTAHRSLFFLDQYGWSDVPLATIRTILGTLRNPEILLTFAVDALIDFLSVKTAESQALLNIELTREDVRALMGLKTGEGWRYLIQNGLYRHVQDRTGSRFYTPFFIHSVEAHRSYWLLHLASPSIRRSISSPTLRRPATMSASATVPAEIRRPSSASSIAMQASASASLSTIAISADVPTAITWAGRHRRRGSPGCAPRSVRP